MVRFIDRVEELELLERDWEASENAFLIAYGRRRIGKTRLFEEFLKGKEGVRYTAENTNKKIQVNEFRRILASYLNDPFLANQEMADWSILFSYLAKTLDRNKRFYIWIDEFSYVVKNDLSVTSILQIFIDEFLRNSRLCLLVSGSLFGLMRDEVLSSSSPLYGRRTRDILLKPIPAPYIAEFLPFRFEETLQTALTVGGIPEYLRVASKYHRYNDFMTNEFFKTEGYFYREPYFLLSQEFKEIKTYFSILNAIAYGNSKPSDIANFVGINAREIYPYLELLIGYKFVERETSLFGDSKRGVYRLYENFLDFWFNFIHRNREQMERGSYHPRREELNIYFGRRFEAFVRENLRYYTGEWDRVGRWWHEDKEIDAIALNERTNEMLVVECKWQDGVDAYRIAKDLNEKAVQVPRMKQPIEKLAIFSKSFRKRIDELEGKPVRCYDLNDLEKAFRSAAPSKS